MGELRRLLSSYDANSCDPQKQSPLHLAASAGNAACLTAVLQWAKASTTLSVNHMPGGFGSTPLHMAVAGSAECVRVLLAAGADPLIRNNWGDTPLHYAARQGKKGLAAIEALLQFGAKKMKTEGAFVRALETGRYKCPYTGRRVSPTSLLAEVFSSRYDIEVLRRLLDAGASMEVDSEYVGSVLNCAVYEDELRDDAVQLFCERGLSTDIINQPRDFDEVESPCGVLFDIAGCRPKKKKRNIVNTLLKHGATATFEHLKYAVECGDVVLFDAVFSHMCHPNRLMSVLKNQNFLWVFDLLYSDVGFLEVLLRNDFSRMGVARDSEKKRWKKENLLGPLLTQNYTRRSCVAALRLLEDAETLQLSRQDPASLTSCFPTMHEYVALTKPLQDKRERAPSPLFVRRHWQLLTRVYHLLDWDLDWTALLLTGPQQQSISNCVVRAFSLARAFVQCPLEKLVSFQGRSVKQPAEPKCKREVDKHRARHRLLSELYSQVSVSRLSPAAASSLRLPERHLCQPPSLLVVARSAVYSQLWRTRRRRDGRFEKMAPAVERTAALLPEEVRPLLTLRDASTRQLLRRMMVDRRDSAWVETEAPGERDVRLKDVGEAAAPLYCRLRETVLQWEQVDGADV